MDLGHRSRRLKGILRLRIAVLAALLALLPASPASAHPAPFSYLDLHLDASGLSGTLVVHDLDAAHDLGVQNADSLLVPAEAARFRDALIALLSPRLQLTVDGTLANISWGEVDVVPDRQSLRLAFKVSSTRPGHVAIQAHLFPYDPIHQTFINVYEDSALKLQQILDASHQTTEYYSGSTQGRWAVIKTFVLSGIEHILIGPDHILFLIGLLLLGGSLPRLALIVTSFTIGHSVTLSLAALDILSPPARLIEPLIALTIVVVGADNLLVLRSRQREATPGKEADIRAWLAVAFGLIHGFGFAYVLKEFGLPQAALAWSLLAFNVGVEIGQLLIVAVAAGTLALVHRRSEGAARQIAVVGSIAVILAGTYWFIERVFLV
jgi:hypothetical protein